MRPNRLVVGLLAGVGGMVTFLALRLRRRAGSGPPRGGADPSGVREPRVPAPTGGSAAAAVEPPTD